MASGEKREREKAAEGPLDSQSGTLVLLLVWATPHTHLCWLGETLYCICQKRW